MRELDNAYRILELEPGASMEEVNQAYKDLVFVWHPDRIPQDNERLYQKAQDKIKALNQARDVLRSHNPHDRSSASATTSRYGYRASTAGDRAYSGYGYRSTYNGSSYNGNGSGNGRPSESASEGAQAYGSTYQNRYYRYQRGSYSSSYYGQPDRDPAADQNGNDANFRSTNPNNGKTTTYEAPSQGSSYNPRSTSGARTSSTPGANPRAGTASSYGASSAPNPTPGFTADYGASSTHGSPQAAGSYQTYRQRRDAAAGVGTSQGTNVTNGSTSPNTHSNGYRPPDTSYGQAKPRDNGGDQSYNTYNAHTRNSSASAHRARQSPDLSGADLSGANLREKDFANRNLSGANLSGADLSDAFLHKVNLNRANLSRAKLFRANLLQADLSHANLREANLIGADFSGADLSGADLSGAKVAVGGRTMVKLTGTVLTGAIMPDGSIHD